MQMFVGHLITRVVSASLLLFIVSALAYLLQYSVGFRSFRSERESGVTTIGAVTRLHVTHVVVTLVTSFIAVQ